jgi:hypothetical protein
MADVTVEFGATDTGLEKTLKAVQDELTQLKGKVSSGELSMTELENTMKRIGQVTSMEKNIKAIGDSSTATSPKVDELGNDMKTAGDKAEDAGKKGKTGFGEIAIGAGIAGAAVKLGTAAIDAAFAVAQKTVQSFGDALNMGGRLAELSDRTGVAVDKVMLLERAFQNTGVGADSLGPILNKMQKAIVDAGDGTSKAADAFTKLGIPLSTLQDLSPDEQLRAIGKAIAGIPDPAERAAVSMEVFGKSGGALNQVFANMDGEIETAKAQLGSLPEVMKAGAAQFDKISDNLTVVGGKFVEFAAGIIDKVKPALDAITTALTRIDATKLGQDLAGFFTGAGAGMQGFQAAVDAIDAGEMGTAFKIVAQAIQIQFKETGNSIYASMVAAFQTAGEFAAKIFDPSGALSQTILMSFDLLANKAGASIMSGLAKAFDGSYLTRGIADALREMAAESTKTAKIAEEGLKGAGSRIAQQFTETGKALPQSFKDNMAGVPPLFTGIEKHQQEIDRLQQGITRSTKETTVAISDQAKEDAKAEQEARKYFQDHKKFQEDQEKANAKKTADQEAANKLKQQELAFQLEFATAQAAGDTEHIEQLNAQKKWLEDYQKALAAGLGEEQAQNFATNMAIAATNSANIKQYDKDGNQLFFKAAENASKLNESLASATGFADTLANMKEIKVMDKAANSAKAATEELRAMDKLLGTDLAQKSFPDLAKKLGVDKIGQTGEEQIRAVVTYLNGVKTDLSKSPIDSKKGQEDILNLVKFFGGNPIKADLITDDAKKKLEDLTKTPAIARLQVDQVQVANAIGNMSADIRNNLTGGQGGPGGDAGQGGVGGEGGVGGDAQADVSTISYLVKECRDWLQKISGSLPYSVLIP